MAPASELFVALFLALLQSSINVLAVENCLPSDSSFCRCSTRHITLDINQIGLSYPVHTLQGNVLRITYTPCDVQQCGNLQDDMSVLCQLHISSSSYYSLGTYTNFKWSVIHLDPLEFEIRYGGGTLAHRVSPPAIRKSFVYFKSGIGLTNFTFNNEEYPVIYHLNVSGEGVAPVKGISPPTDVTAVQDGLTSIILSWTPSNEATGYRIYYDSSGGHSGFEDVNGGSTDTYRLSSLQSRDHYTLSIMATSIDPPSILVQLRLFLISSPPGEVRLIVTAITSSSITLSWSVASGTVDFWEVVWRENERNQTSGRITVTYYTIYELKANTSYNITVRASNMIGTTDSNSIIFDVSTKYPPPLPSTSPSSTTTMDTKMDAKCSNNTDNAIYSVVGGIALLCVLMLTLSVSVIAVIVLKRRLQANLSSSAHNRRDVLDSRTGEVTASDGIYEDPYDLVDNQVYGVTTRRS